MFIIEQNYTKSDWYAVSFSNDTVKTSCILFLTEYFSISPHSLL